MDLQPTLEDNLIILRPLEPTDFEALYEVAKDPLIWQQHQNSDRYKSEVFKQFFSDSIKSKAAFLIIEKSTNKVIGSTRFKLLDTSDLAVEIGWSFLSRSYWGGMYNKSMKTLMIDYAFKHVDHIIFYIDKENFRSQKAVKKLGGKQIITEQYKHLVKKSETDLTLRIGKEDWQSH